MNLSEVWKAVDLDAADAALPDLPRSTVHVVLILASPGVREGGWAGRAALEMCRGWGADGAQVLLADASLESPELHLPAGLDNLEGITDALLFGTSFQRLGQPLSEGLILATAGTAVPGGEALRAHPRWRDFAAGFSEAGAILALYLPSDAPGADALMALADVAVALVRADEAESLELPDSLLVLAAVGPEVAYASDAASGLPAHATAQEDPSSEQAPAAGDPAPDADEILGDPFDDPEEAGEALAGAWPAADAGAEVLGESEVDGEMGEPILDDGEVEGPVLDESVAQEDGVALHEDMALDLEEGVFQDADLPEGDSPAEPEAPTLDEILAEAGSDVPADGAESADRIVAEDMSDPLAAAAADAPPASGDPVDDADPVDAQAEMAPADAESGDLVADQIAAGVQDPGAPAEDPDITSDVEPGLADQPVFTRPRGRDKPARQGPSPVLLFLLLFVVVAALAAGWLGFIEIPGITPASGGVEEAGATEVTSPDAGPVSQQSDGESAGTAEVASPEERNPLAAWVLAVGSYSELETARSRARTYGAALPEVQFIVAPVEIDGVPYFRLLAGPAADVETLETVQAEVARVLPAEQEWILREAGLAYLMSSAGRLSLAERQAEVLERTGIPAHVLRYETGDGSDSWRVYSGAYANPAEAEYLGRILAESGIDQAPLTERRGVRPE